MPGKQPKRVILSMSERAELQAFVNEEVGYDPNVRTWEVQRARIILMAADGKTNQEIAQVLDISDSMASQWRQRWTRYSMLPVRDRIRHFNEETIEQTRTAIRSNVIRFNNEVR
jgi:hypothetical protein